MFSRHIHQVLPPNRNYVLFFFPLPIPRFQGFPTLSTNLFKSLLRKVSALLPSPSKHLHSLTELISDTLLSSHSPYAHCPHMEELHSATLFINMSTSEPFPPQQDSCLPKIVGQLFLEDAKNTIYGKTKQNNNKKSHMLGNQSATVTQKA